MGKTEDIFKKIGDIKGTIQAKMGTIRDRTKRDLTKVEEIKKRWQEYTELYQKSINDPDNHDVVVTTQRQISWTVKSSGPYKALL